MAGGLIGALYIYGAIFLGPEKRRSSTKPDGSISTDGYQRDGYVPEPAARQSGRIPVPCPGVDLRLDVIHDVLAADQRERILHDYTFNRGQHGTDFALDRLEAAVTNNPILNRDEKIAVVDDVKNYHEVTLPKFFSQGE